MSKPHKVLVCFGTRPEIIKLSPVIFQLQKATEIFQPILLNTAQHREMSSQFLNNFGIKADSHLDIMSASQSLSDITTRVLSNMESLLPNMKPDCILIQGDTTTAFACALAGFYHQIPIGHVEAGLRTYDMGQPFPEELNRQLIARMARWHFAPTQQAKDNLLKEGANENCIYLTGNTVVDALYYILNSNCPVSSEAKEILDLKEEVLLITMHRRESLGASLDSVVSGLSEIATKHPELILVFPIHPNPKIRMQVEPVLGGLKNVKLITPQDYTSFVQLMKKASLILTDSGGIQEEASYLGKFVCVLREKTCRQESILSGAAHLIGTSSKEIARVVNDFLSGAIKIPTNNLNLYGDGKAAERIVAKLRETLP